MAQPSLDRIIRAKFWVQHQLESRVEQQLSTDMEALELLRDQALKSLQASGSASDLEDLLPRFFAADIVFPRLLRSALLGSTFSLFEHSLHALCADLGKRTATRLTVDDLRGSGIGRAKLFLERVAGVPFPNPDPLWEDIDHIRLLRNCIVHSTGHLRDRESALGRFVRQHPSLEMDEGTGIYLKREFHTWAVGQMEAFVTRVLSHSYDGRGGDGAA